MASRAKTHYVVLRLQFAAPVSRTEALALATKGLPKDAHAIVNHTDADRQIRPHLGSFKINRIILK